MIELGDNQLAEYCHRSYLSVDGLWFMKAEEKYVFESSLEVDNKVWKGMPKIQARMLKSMGKLGDGVEALFDVATTKLTLGGSIFEIGKKDKLLKRCINQTLTQPT